MNYLHKGNQATVYMIEKEVEANKEKEPKDNRKRLFASITKINI